MVKNKVNFIIKEMNDILNEQIVEEWRSAYIYLGMSTWAEEKGLKGLAKFMQIHAETEEYKHGMKFMKYIQEAGGKVELGTIEQVGTEYTDVEGVLLAAIKHEEHITACINKIMDLAQEKKEYAAYDMLNWFVQEQIEEENLFTDLYDAYLLTNKRDGYWDRHVKHPE